MYDLIIVGGGPAGTSAGRAAGIAGLKTLLIEKDNLKNSLGNILIIKLAKDPVFVIESHLLIAHLDNLPNGFFS